MFASVLLDAGTPLSSRYSVNSSNHSNHSNLLRNGFPMPESLRDVAGPDEVSSDVSCGNDREVALALELEEPVDNNRHTFPSVAKNSFAIVGQLWFLTTGPLVRVSVLFAELA